MDYPITREQVRKALAATESVLEELAPDLAQAYLNALDRIDALENLLICYRTGTRPSETLLERLRDTRERMDG